MLSYDNWLDQEWERHCAHEDLSCAQQERDEIVKEISELEDQLWNHAQYYCNGGDDDIAKDLRSQLDDLYCELKRCDQFVAGAKNYKKRY